jgi:hypothetical protein
MPVAFNSAGLNACPKELNTISRVPVRGLAFDGTGQSQAIHLRHLHIQERQVVRLASLGCGSQPLQGFLTAGGTSRLDPPRPKLMAQDSTVSVVVIDRQHAESGQITATEFGRRGVDGLLFQLHCKPESGAFARFAFHPDLTLHEGPTAWKIARPKPVPPYLRVVEPSAWLNA